jgi:transcriptional regulator with PAS, ATPase and Fis domain
VAHNSTLFLDELGELPLSAQVKLLRVLQEGKVTRLGSHKPISVDVRVIAATNRHLQEEVAEGRFREDLFFRLAVATFRIPPLRERMEDVELLVGTFLEQINEQGENEEPAYEAKTLSTEAKSRLNLHHWPGNIRELYNTLLRAAIWSEEVELGFDDIEDALMLSNLQGSRESGGILGRPLVEGFDVEKVMGEVAIHYIDRALIEAKNKTQAAKLVGLGSYQTMDKWLEKYKAVVDEP